MAYRTDDAMAFNKLPSRTRDTVGRYLKFNVPAKEIALAEGVRVSTIYERIYAIERLIGCRVRRQTNRGRPRKSAA